MRNGEDIEEIAHDEKTSRNYVYKISSLEKIRTISTRMKNAELDVGNDQGLEDKPKNDVENMTSPLKPELRKKVYNDFFNDLSDRQIIGKYGLDPVIMKRERQGSYEVSDFIPHIFQKELLMALGKPANEADQIIDANKDKLLSNQALIGFVLRYANMKIGERLNFLINEMISDLSINLPPDYSRLTCINCVQPMPGLIFSIKSLPQHIGNVMFFSCFLCKRCYDNTIQDTLRY